MICCVQSPHFLLDPLKCLISSNDIHFDNRHVWRLIGVEVKSLRSNVGRPKSTQVVPGRPGLSQVVLGRPRSFRLLASALSQSSQVVPGRPRSSMDVLSLADRTINTCEMCVGTVLTLSSGKGLGLVLPSFKLTFCQSCTLCAVG